PSFRFPPFPFAPPRRRSLPGRSPDTRKNTMRRYSPPHRSPPRRGYGGSPAHRSPPRRGYGGSPPHRSPPRRGYGGRGRSPPRRGGYGGRKEQGSGSLLVRNIPLSARAEDLRVPFERFGPVRDVYLPKDYYSGEPRGFAFVEFVDPYDASEAQYHMNRQVFFGREITVVLAAESRKRPEDMRTRTRVRGYSGGHEGRRSSHYGRSRSRSRSASPRPRGGGRARSRCHTLLLQDGEMTTLLPHGEGSLIARNLLCVIQKNMRRTKGDPTLPLVEMVTNVMLITGMRRGRHRPTVMDPLHARGWPGHPQDRPLDPAPGPPTLLLPAATEKLVTSSAVAASPSSYFHWFE
uniref:RRM domain-containing protein n=1 Tax=Aegilops tauschii subsp. strangulata TaxID=200361 RepID=A0A453JX27_AEGTS